MAGRTAARALGAKARARLEHQEFATLNRRVHRTALEPDAAYRLRMADWPFE
jgi:hypothetical protein